MTATQSPAIASFLAIAMIASFALLWGGYTQIRRGGADRRRGMLMLVAAVVLLANVVILAV